MALIAGLGNPGAEYDETRHNVGFKLIDILSEKLSISLEPDNGLYQIGEGRFKGQPVVLLKPTTFMNKSGKAVKRALNKTGLSSSECMICYDDIHLDVGTIRIRNSGSAGGHNGVEDIINELQTRDFPRLRIGIGNDFRRGQLANYVLSPFPKDQIEEIEAALEVASNAILTFLRGGINIAMNEFN